MYVRIRAVLRFPIYAKDEDLTIISYVCDGAFMVWYVIDSSYCLTFEECIAQHAYAPRFLNDF